MMDFIGVYENTISPEICTEIIDIFESLELKRGTSGGNKFNKNIKDSYDHSFLFSDSKDTSPDKAKTYFITNNILDSIENNIQDYKQKHIQYPHKMYYWSLWNIFKIQKYIEGGGYHSLHSEQGIQEDTVKRMLVWMLYLNDSECGTEFPQWNTLVEAKQGRLVLWPAAWTHMHKGVTPNIGTKYIATGWFNYGS